MAFCCFLQVYSELRVYSELKVYSEPTVYPELKAYKKLKSVYLIYYMMRVITEDVANATNAARLAMRNDALVFAFMRNPDIEHDNIMRLDGMLTQFVCAVLTFYENHFHNKIYFRISPYAVCLQYAVGRVNPIPRLVCNISESGISISGVAEDGNIVRAVIAYWTELRIPGLESLIESLIQ